MSQFFVRFVQQTSGCYLSVMYWSYGYPPVTLNHYCSRRLVEFLRKISQKLTVSPLKTLTVAERFVAFYQKDKDCPFTVLKTNNQ